MYFVFKMDIFRDISFSDASLYYLYINNKERISSLNEVSVQVANINTGYILLAMHTSRTGRNLLSISTAAKCLTPACKIDLVIEPGPAPTSHT